jgi:23S rRNA (cytosine1962-C5)-methyltransferase
MYNQPRTNVKTYDIHPSSIKQIQKGHPWVTIDKFSENFHPKDKFIVAASKGRPFALLIHDPTHKTVRARVWATDGDFPKQIKSFKNDIIKRVRVSIQKRLKSDYKQDRNHYYLVFGEADDMPGVLIHFLNGEILIQFYMDFWSQFQDFVVQTTLKCVNDLFKLNLTIENIWIQNRTKTKEKAKCLDPNSSFRNIEVEELGVKYKVTLGKYYDHGIYTDMAGVRNKMKSKLSTAKSVLNLFSYTGAFSLYALSLGAEKVTSVDLSQDYLSWLKQNIDLNSEILSDKHESICGSTINTLKKLKQEERKFDFIISDPPSSSSDGNRRSNALTDYSETLPLMVQQLNSFGRILVFINTHKVSMKKFEDKIRLIIDKSQLGLKVESKYFLAEDCPSKKGFPEGSYLKGLLLQRYD